jgi:membrane-anchored mycosin MYCP
LPSPDGTSGAGALLSVGGVGANGQLAAAYQGSTVDVVAPGIDVASLGLDGNGTVTNSGSQYAVAFVAGQAALVRAAFPDLTAAQVKKRIESTADRMGPIAPDKQFGWGMINPSSAVTAKVADEQPTAVALRSKSGGATGMTLMIAAVVLVLVGAVTLLVVRSRRFARTGYEDDE